MGKNTRNISKNILYELLVKEGDSLKCCEDVNEHESVILISLLN